MHLLMSFLGSIGAVMADNELREILAEIFNGVDKIIVGKKFVMDLWALRMMVNEIVWQVVNSIIIWTSIYL